MVEEPVGSRQKAESSKQETKEDLSAGALAKEDERYYVPCPARKNQARIPVVRCFDCEFATGRSEGLHVEIGCGFPVGRTMKKGWRRKGSNVKRPAVKRIERDGLS